MEERKELVHLPNCELEIMMIIWGSKNPVSRTEMDEELRDKNLKAAAVLKFLSRLTEKGFIKCERPEASETDFYTALVTEEEYIEFERDSVLGEYCGKSVRSLIANFYENKKIDDKDLDALEKIIAGARGRK
ncbi:MAG: BlaI/MecI/CopY family transcriptional regulator [Clostridia bacterium]|nr:BlaI/MecI/CopY family transcriptional regulator [Clostridia bacterium]MBQ8767375.1 BlaI/MecI/CopY family transcriptional regulator [Clostridia bacterium]